MTVEYSRLVPLRLATAVSAALGVAYVVCAAAVAIAPEFSLTLLGWMVHLVNVDQFVGASAITPLAFLGGLLQVVVYAYALTWIAAVTYNGIGRRKASSSRSARRRVA